MSLSIPRFFCRLADALRYVARGQLAEPLKLQRTSLDLARNAPLSNGFTIMCPWVSCAHKAARQATSPAPSDFKPRYYWCCQGAHLLPIQYAMIATTRF